MITSKERVNNSISHISPDVIPVDFGATSVTGIHCKVVEQLRQHYGLEYKPVKIIEPFQMLGEIDEELKQVMHLDCEHVFGAKDMLGIEQTPTKECRTPWGQIVFMPEKIDMTPDSNGDIWLYPEADRTAQASAVMTEGCYFMNAIERGEPYDEDNLDPAYNLEEFGYITDADLDYFAQQTTRAAATQRAIVASFGGTALGDVAFIPGASLKNPRGIRGVADWYMSTLLRPDYIHQVFEKQIEIAISNYQKLWDRVGSNVDVVFTCGTDFGSQESQFCSVETFDELWLPHYRKMNDWIHNNTTWKTFKHSCGAVLPLIPSFIEAGFDILNPIQINASNMDSKMLKSRFGDDIVFWGGGIETQKILPNATPEQVAEHVREQCDILGQSGGFVFTSIHNVQANVPVNNLIAAIDEVNRLRNLSTVK